VRAIVAMLAALGAGACGTDGADQPRECDSLVEVQAPLDHVQNANVSENGLSQLRTDLNQLNGNLQQLYADLESQFADEVAALKAAVDEFSASLATARDTPGSTTFAAVCAALLTVADRFGVWATR
jgi:nitrate/nitrite-specific signal transduction histidine kinase